MNRKEKIIYCAGIVDGEGYVAIKKSQYKGRCPSPTYHERIQIRMVDEEVIAFFKELFGGSYYKEKSNCTGGKPLYCYQASDLIAYHACNTLLPYLIIKRKNAERILLLRHSKKTIKPEQRGTKGRRMAQEVLNYRENLYQLCKKGGDLKGGKVETVL